MILRVRIKLPIYFIVTDDIDKLLESMVEYPDEEIHAPLISPLRY